MRINVDITKFGDLKIGDMIGGKLEVLDTDTISCCEINTLTYDATQIKQLAKAFGVTREVEVPRLPEFAPMEDLPGDATEILVKGEQTDRLYFLYKTSYGNWCARVPSVSLTPADYSGFILVKRAGE